ncbi:T9SS type A sorting domain-containing protein [Tamlana fucoidanivorans]|uniref:T9SS type A sorting domain-containing protein n=1 Tax=Allotamlana fucoidanivorans TaxID=2583814 RepID=A0A5C4SLU4_9FLAO|nr:LamG-like jellyroll fold domain-containing protein [Tamlana fucoidanivorans]TNJ44649.1 T9SS type A sorting domain-containing protein [Tamlana fucoidanivorans]
MEPNYSLKFWLSGIFVLITFLGVAQDINVNILGGATISDGGSVAITAGNAITFRITNTRADCEKVKIEDISISNTADFSLSTDKIPKNIDRDVCNGNTKYIDFVVTNVSGDCSASTAIDILVKQDPNFTFTFSISGSPEINLLGGSPSADILHGTITTSATNGTYFGVVEEGETITRYFVVSSTGSCPLTISGISSSSTHFVVPTSPAPYVVLPDLSTPAFLTASVDAGSYVILPVTFVAPSLVTGTVSATISISNNDNTTFTFNVSAEMFDFNIPGPGGITADFRLWLKSTRGVTKDTSSKVSVWSDIGTNGKDAIQPVSANQPIYIDDAASNINFNPVIAFENDGSSISQYLYNTDNGFYSQDIFIVMESDTDVASSSGMTIFSGSIADIITPENYVDDVNDVTAVGLGDYTTNLSGERLWYNQGSSASNPYYALPASTTRAYSVAGIINAGNKTTTVSDGMRILYNSVDDAESSVQSITTFENVGSVDTAPDPDVTLGTPYAIGKNSNQTLGNLNGRVAEIFTFADRVSDADRQKIESYLAIKYGISLGASNQAQKNYVNSFGTTVWDVSANSGYNYHVAGIGRDSISDLNQKQSKTLNVDNEVTIGLNGIFSTNNANINAFNNDGDFLVWGSNNLAYTTSGSNTVSISSGITTSLTRILRQWKIVESTEVSSDVENVYVSIPEAAFSGMTKASNEEYVLIVAKSDSFADTDIVDVIPLKSDGAGNLLTWYDFDGTKYFTFGKAEQLQENHAISIASGDYLVGEYALNLNINDFTISSWVKANASQTTTRTIMAKGDKLQLRLNASHQVEVMVDDTITPRFTSSMALTDSKWHQITFVYNSGTIFLYVDGVLDKSELNVVAPSPNFNRFSVGALYIDKNNISNPFLGEIDEVYVWDQGLSEEQVHYLMNQEIEKGTGDVVSGKVLPQAASSNEVSAIPWSDLRAYYDFNSFYGSTVEGLTDARNFLRLKYLEVDKEVVEAQTIPVPYMSIANGNWDASTTWSNSTDQVLPNALSLDGSTMIDWNIVQIEHDINSGDRDVSLLGLIQSGGTLTISDPNESQDETNSGQGLTITHYLELDGVIDLIGESQLIQTEGSVLDADSGGYIERDQQGTANAFNYNYWSSSVGPISGNTATRGTGISSTNAAYTIDTVLNDGSLPAGYTNLNFETSPYASDGTTPPPGFVKTISSYWLYKYYGPANDYYAWAKINENSSLLPGEGYTMKGTSGAVSVDTQQNYVFEGLPNNGDITLALDKSLGDVERLIGNPYPSAIDATEFILDNLSIADGGNNLNGTVFNGALYFWDHFGEQNSHILKDYVGGYATRNLTGGAVAISNDSRINSTSNGGNPAVGTKIPGQYIPLNQGFFVGTSLEGFNNDNGSPITSVVGGNVVFKNSQRVFAPEDGTTSQFLKASKRKRPISPTRLEHKTPTINLMYDSPMGYHRQIVLGLNTLASTDFDLGYDAPMADVAVEDMYWVLNKFKLVIQGVDSFEDFQQFPIGLKVKKAGIVKIRLDGVLNLEADKVVYIEDKISGETFNLTNGAFELYLEPGHYNDRFQLTFRVSNDNLLAIDEVNLGAEHDILAYFDSNNSVISIINKESIQLLDVSVFNVLGQHVMSMKLDSRHNAVIPIEIAVGAYIVKLNTEKGSVAKRIIID